MQNFNQNPYFDDFNEDKNFHKILFKPGVSVQARELTQSQSIAQDQMRKFGDHIFKHGSVVLPGNSTSDLYTPYVKIQNLTTEQLANIAAFDSAAITSTTGVTAIVRKAVATEGLDPTTLYLAYNSGGTGGESTFADGETLTVAGVSVTAWVEDATGIGSMAFINAGVYYVSGQFVKVHKQAIPISKYTQTPSCHVLLKITESIVDSDADNTLLDPSQGSYNYAAPGSDRYKITLTLTSIPLGAAIEDNYFEIMRFNNGILEEHARYPKYNELEKSLARRTYDESGDYVVSGLDVSVKEHLKSSLNGGVYSEESGGDRDLFIAEVKPGKAYIRGFENEKLASSILPIEKGRATDHIKTKANIGFYPKFGQYLYVSGLVNLPVFADRDVITLRNYAGVVVGTARVLTIELYSGSSTPSLNIHRLYVYDLSITSKLSDLHTIQTGSDLVATINHKLGLDVSGVDFASSDILSTAVGAFGVTVQYLPASKVILYTRSSSTIEPVVGLKITSGTKEGVVRNAESGGNLPGNTSIITLPFDASYKARTVSGTVDCTYSVQKQVSMTLVGGSGSATIVGAEIESFQQADPIAIHSTLGTIPLTSGTCTAAGTSITLTGLGAYDGLVSIVLTAKKTNQVNKTKTLTMVSESKSAAAVIELAKCDVYKLVSVIDATSTNVTSRFSLDSGQRDFAYLAGNVILKAGATLPAGPLVVTYQYFQHSGSGDYFSIDSYENSGLGVNYYDQIPEYRSGTDGAVYKLKNSLDFRPKVGVETSLIDLVRIDSRLSTSIQYYVPRYDLIIMDKSGTLQNIRGTPADAPEIPKQPAESILLATIGIPAYTSYIKNITIEKAKNVGYTMAEISGIEDRIYNLEQYSLLTQSEKTLINTDVVDPATGLSRFKSGYLVDSFDNPDTIGDSFNPEFSATYVDGMLMPKIERNELSLAVIGATGAAVSAAGYYTLAYTEVVFAQQKLSSRVTNVNPFSVFTWNGAMTLTPSADSWVDTYNLPAVFNTTNAGKYENVEVKRPWDWQPTPGATVRYAPTPVPIATARCPEMTRDSAKPPIGPVRQTRPIPNDSAGIGEVPTNLYPVSDSISCFLPGTLVDTFDRGIIPIADVKLGDRVWNHNHTDINTVRFIEVVNNTFDLYSPDTSLAPFVTVNHPLYIAGQLCSVIENSNYENWLGPMRRLIPAAIVHAPVCRVYNLWVTGDNTYRVNGYGTTSIMGDGAWLSSAFERGLLTQCEVLDIAGICSLNNNRQHGAIIVNRVLRNVVSSLINKFLSDSLKNDGFRRNVLLGLFSAVGKICRKF